MTRPVALKTTSSPVAAVPPRRIAHRAALGVLHLRGDRAHPDQLVEAELVAAADPVWAGVRNGSPAGRIASCASWAFLTFEA